MLFFPANVVGDGQSHFAADLFGGSCRAVTQKGRVVHLTVDADAVCDQVDVQVVGVLMGAGQSLGIGEIHFGGECAYNFAQVFVFQSCLVPWSNTDLKPQVFVPAALVGAVDHFELAQNPVGVQTAQQVGRKYLSELVLTQSISDGISAVADGSSFSYHVV